jgi:hypothetical protein
VAATANTTHRASEGLGTTPRLNWWGNSNTGGLYSPKRLESHSIWLFRPRTGRLRRRPQDSENLCSFGVTSGIAVIPANRAFPGVHLDEPGVLRRFYLRFASCGRPGPAAAVIPAVANGNRGTAPMLRCVSGLPNRRGNRVRGLASSIQTHETCCKTNSEGKVRRRTAGTREQKIWTQSHITLMELRDV